MFPAFCSGWPGRLCRTRLGPAPQVEQPAAVIKAVVFGHGPVPVGVSNKCCFDRNVWEQNRLCPQTEPLNLPALPPPPLPQLTSCGSTEPAGPKVQEPERIGTQQFFGFLSQVKQNSSGSGSVTSSGLVLLDPSGFVQNQAITFGSDPLSGLAAESEVWSFAKN